MSDPGSERAPLLVNGADPGQYAADNNDGSRVREHARRRVAVGGVLTLVFIVSLVVSLTIWSENLPRDPHKAALRILEKVPVIVRAAILVCRCSLP